MSRPQDLPVLLKGFGAANYPAGSNSWSNQPQRLAPAGALVPGVTIPAPVLNYLAGNALDEAQNALNVAGQLPALNWGTAVATGATINTYGVGWSDYEQAWYVVQNNSTAAFRSVDFGKSWLSNTLANSMMTTSCIAFDTSGNAVVCGSGSLVITGSASASYANPVTWSYTTGVFPSATLYATTAFDPVSGLWALLAEAAGTTAYTSSNRTTWTARTVPSGWSGVRGNSAIRAGNGLLVASIADSSTTIRTMVSANGGVSWTNDQQIITALSGLGIGTFVKPYWSATDGLWYLMVPSSGGSQLFTSPNAISWSAVRTFAQTLNAFGGLGSLLVAVDANGYVGASWNQGVSWYRCGYSGVASPNLVNAGGNGFLISGQANAAPSQRFGLPVTAF